MKNRISKILGLGLALVLALALVVGFALPVAAAETINEWYTFDYPVEGEDGDWFRDAGINVVGPMAQAINGDLYAYVDHGGDDLLFKSDDGGRTWAETGYDDVDSDPVTPGVQPPGAIVDMVCSSIDEDIIYVTDGNYVYKSTDGGDEFATVAAPSLEELLMGTCGVTIIGEPITCLDVTYNDDEDPFVFIGVDDTDDSAPSVGEPSVLYINEGGYPSQWTDLRLSCFHGPDGNYTPYSIGCAPDWADSKETYVVVSTPDEAGLPVSDPHTWVVYTIGYPCGWSELAELFWDCDDPDNNFQIQLASRIAFPDDWEDSESLFVGVVDTSGCSITIGRGGDVYSATADLAIDRNVAGIGTAGGCVGVGAVDIISLDIYGDYDEAALIAGAFCDTNVYYSTDGGWSWDISAKDPTGDGETYVLWYEGSALAATSGCECAVSLSCITDEVEDVGECWNQISLIATDIDEVLWNDYSPGYITESETLFMVTHWGNPPSPPCGGDGIQSLFRYDGTYWERVFCGTIAGADRPDWIFERVQVSPDFNNTNCVYVAGDDFEIWRSLDAGCSWDKLTFPCSPRPKISLEVVIDEDTVIAGGKYKDVPERNAEGKVFKTTRHGARPWDEYEYYDYLGTPEAKVISLALEPGYEDPGTILLGDNQSQVFISEDGGETWDLVEAALDTTAYDTSVVFDPGYATNNTIYAAAGSVIARCIIDPDEDWVDQEWVDIGKASIGETDDVYMGIVAAGDTALYVTDTVIVDDDAGVFVDGGVLRSLNPDAEDETDVVFERLCEGLTTDTALWRLMLTTDVSDDGCAENVLWARETDSVVPHYENIWTYEDTLAAPVVLGMPVEGQKLGTTGQATLSWNELCGADCYEVSLYKYCPECPEEKVEVDISDLMDCHKVEAKYTCTEDICIVVDGLETGTTYYWQVRVCIGEPTLSKWSEERTFTTALLAVPYLCSPACGGQDIILTPNFSWDAVDGATGYDIELATTETFTAGVVKGSSTVNAWVYGTPLDYATTYYWRVRAEKDGVYSDWTVCIFTTMEAPAPPPPPPVEITPAPPAPIINIPPAEQITPSWIYAIIGIGAALAVVVIVLIVRTRRPPA